ncbi:Oxidoreductase family, NAD-binding Rossmann fold [Sinosporangium album]|uniref:Oxidoreductase family, NAD-binding Rossmann fold n=1 Tax=Sinosporangium album TaxID=504805 RepID=A0A1G8L2U0_9ACTN|nr:Gfo/Idh/MocA family oxidoreductase [Sinosporangium album]SDI49976.1 Oxidoreductase family, NAD-binding Rossmann fold [Sinosporangium album]
MTTDTAIPSATTTWEVVGGPIPPAAIEPEAAGIAARHQLRLHRPGPQAHLQLTEADGTVLVAVSWRPATPALPEVLSHVLPGRPRLDILIDARPGGQAAADDLHTALREQARRYDPSELSAITASMPLLARHSTPDANLAGWAVIARDHYVENTLALLLAIQRCGVPPQWIYALAKGDRTRGRDRIHATLTGLGCASGVLDNTAINAPDSHAADLAQTLVQVDAFIDAAHAAGRPVLVIDDGGLIAQGYGRPDAPRRIDAALELTVSGLKRITAARPLAIPVFNMARSAVKTRLGYPEIADACVRRLRALLPAVKTIGRPVLVLGYGTLGSRLAAALHAHGCQLHVVDPDPLALIAAAEAGHATYRTAVHALRTTVPLIVAGTTGDSGALPEEAIALLPDGAILAPFATADFAPVTSDTSPAQQTGHIPGVGRRYRLPTGAEVTMLGDGRSLNLFEADAIPNQGYDAYRAGTLIAARALCAQAATLPPGVHTTLVDTLIAASGLYDDYYRTYLTSQAATPTPAPTLTVREPSPVAGLNACVVGYGAAGRLHAGILTGAGAELTILDPKHQDLPRTCRSFHHNIDDLPATRAIDLWSVCCPTAEHLSVLRSILARDPAARVLLEKPACQAHEIVALTDLLDRHPRARLLVTDQYQHATALDGAAGLLAQHAGGPIDHLTVSFTKDRTADIADGRFIDRSYGVLGYEWLHMLAVLRRLLPAEAMTSYLTSDPCDATLRAVFDPRLFVATLTEHATAPLGDGLVHLDLHSSITTPAIVVGRTPADITRWHRGLRAADDRQRYLTVHAADTLVTVRLDPVTTTGGWQLQRNQHRLVAERDGKILHDEIIDDSPLHTAITSAAETLTGSQPVPPPDLSGLRRISAMADYLRTQHSFGDAPGQEKVTALDQIMH